MNIKKVIGIILIIISLLLITSFITIKIRHGGTNQEKDAINPTPDSVQVKLTKEQKDEGINGVYQDQATGIIFLDK